MTRRPPGVSAYASCLALAYASLVVSSALVALPTLNALGSVGVTGLPQGDRALFEPGALLLLEIVRVGRTRLVSGLQVSAILMAATALLTLPFTAAVMVRLAHEPPSGWCPWVARTRSHVPTFLLLAGAALLARASVLVLVAYNSARYHDTLLVAFGARAAALAPLAGGLVATITLAVLGAWQDLARAVAVEHGADGWSALSSGLSLAWRYPLHWLLPWAVAAGTTLGATLVVAWASATFDLSRPGAGRPIADFVVCQLAVAVALAARLWWFERVLRLARARRGLVRASDGG